MIDRQYYYNECDSHILLTNYVTKYLSFKNVNDVILKLKCNNNNKNNNICFLNEEITLLLNLFTKKQINGLIRNVFIQMRRLDMLNDNNYKIPQIDNNDIGKTNIEYIIELCNKYEHVTEFLVASMYTYF